MRSSVAFPLLALILALSVPPALGVPKAADKLSNSDANDVLLKPLLPSLNTPNHGEQEKRSTTIKGLLLPPRDGALNKRQRYCVDAGYGFCNGQGNKCCPVGGDCCAGNRCCYPGQRCCSFPGCCDLSDYCVQLSDGRRGCCPIGKICTRGGTTGGDDEDEDNPTTTQRPTTQRTTFTSTSTRTFETTSIASLTVTEGVTAIPTPAGRSLRWWGLSDSRITWTGSWSSVSGAEALCNTTTTTRTCRGTTTSSTYSHSMALAFSGPSLYLRVAAWNARYEFQVNGRTISEHGSYSSRTTVQNCTYIQWQGTRGSNTLRVQVYGYAVSQLFNGRDGLEEDTELKKRDGGDWSFELSNLVVEDDGTSSETSPTTTSPAAGFTLPSNMGVSRRNAFDVGQLGAIGIALLALATLY